ncbi:unnamed protein product [Chondrus crispus]|uniref:Uncharacterized protein n=1 Tax=Chondrus crispus TaxID=2769 RepID=R7Q0P4_CHOCR|nr:unnamed protein product [Chondrus crispus]XP_005711888.1 unnamed protein product [Chondrus crispus]XP_005714082.1 unnamed protein product [Chondrus crispus]CDF32222.1 unnamed protein product [Chondrus crispus]CDF32223.1 unnamed protein product [Chondrus crispus]CDF34263.1 unnamed protein product [Chondrus crispus]|eukprot:XP_005711887.1 unnamed protein product [Chondrus crispus]
MTKLKETNRTTFHSGTPMASSKIIARVVCLQE